LSVVVLKISENCGITLRHTKKKYSVLNIGVVETSNISGAAYTFIQDLGQIPPLPTP
jgi:hypothetical protein